MSGVATLKIRGTKRHFDEMAVDFPVQPQACSPARLRPPPLKRGRTNMSAASSSTTDASSLRHPFRPPSHPLVLGNQQQHHLASTCASSLASSAHAAQQQAANRPTCSASPTPVHNSTATRTTTTGTSSATPTINVIPRTPSNPTLNNSNRSDGANSTVARHTVAPVDEQAVEEPRSPPPTPARPLTTAELSCLARFVPRRLKRAIERLASGLTAPSDKVFSATDLRDAVAAAVEDRDAKLSAQFATVLQERLAEQFRDFTKFNEDYVTRQLRGRETTYLS